ncbi:hypothetical protein RIEGSTA812A_PEG_51 [invertebrate metagenome]|uniref:Uncharacterized protein n=1 Tax=invertebrate metagenome TaxID=1711999 RepID=A0A484H8S7_9ZZZZ
MQSQGSIQWILIFTRLAGHPTGIADNLPLEASLWSLIQRPVIMM